MASDHHANTRNSAGAGGPAGDSGEAAPDVQRIASALRALMAEDAATPSSAEPATTELVDAALRETRRAMLAGQRLDSGSMFIRRTSLPGAAGLIAACLLLVVLPVLLFSSLGSVRRKAPTDSIAMWTEGSRSGSAGPVPASASPLMATDAAGPPLAGAPAQAVSAPAPDALVGAALAEAQAVPAAGPEPAPAPVAQVASAPTAQPFTTWRAGDAMPATTPSSSASSGSAAPTAPGDADRQPPPQPASAPAPTAEQAAKQDTHNAMGRAQPAAPSAEALQDAAPSASARGSAPLLIRNAELTLSVGAVEPAIERVRALVQPERGEFVAAMSQFHERRATLTLRIESTRLPAVLDELRTLGTVTDERATGTDVTSQVIDLDARLRNARQAEAALLALLAKAQDQSLRDVLDVQRELASVREQIERLAAQQRNLHERLALAELKVTLVDPGVSRAQPPSLSAAIRAGLADLRASLVWLVRVLIGGGVFLAIAVVCIALVWRALSRRSGYKV